MISRKRAQIELQIQPNELDNFCVHLIASSYAKRDSVDISKISRCISHSKEVEIILNNNKSITIKARIKHIAKLLKSYHFLRIHKTVLVNTNYIDRFQLEDNTLIMVNGSKLPVSKFKRKSLLKIIETISNNYQL